MHGLHSPAHATRLTIVMNSEARTASLKLAFLIGLACLCLVVPGNFVYRSLSHLVQSTRLLHERHDVL